MTTQVPPFLLHPLQAWHPLRSAMGLMLKTLTSFPSALAASRMALTANAVGPFLCGLEMIPTIVIRQRLASVLFKNHYCRYA